MTRQPDQVSDASMTILLTPGIGPVTMGRLTERFGSHQRIVGATVSELLDIDGIGRETANTLREAFDQADPESERARMREAGACMIMHGDEDYPALLAAIPDPPIALWIKGNLTPEDRLSVAIVGSRRCTAYGREQTGRFASLLAQSGLTIVSGGALGVDAEAHRGTLRVGGRTLAVLGCGLAHCYPPQHDELFERIVASGGAILSEYPMHVGPLAQHFPRRNRIISGLSLGVLVVEAPQRSGALITARQAADEHGREVMALPGRVDSPASTGCLKAIRDGWAAMVLDHADVLNQLDASSHLVRGALEAAGHADAESAATLFDANLTDDQQTIVNALHEADKPLLVDQIAARTQITMSRLTAELTLLQIRGRVHRDQRGISLKK